MPRKYSLYLPAGSLALMCGGIGMVSVPAALIVGGTVVLAAWVAHVEINRRSRG